MIQNTFVNRNNLAKIVRGMTIRMKVGDAGYVTVTKKALEEFLDLYSHDTALYHEMNIQNVAFFKAEVYSQKEKEENEEEYQLDIPF